MLNKKKVQADEKGFSRGNLRAHTDGGPEIRGWTFISFVLPDGANR